MNSAYSELDRLHLIFDIFCYYCDNLVVILTSQTLSKVWCADELWEWVNLGFRWFTFSSDILLKVFHTRIQEKSSTVRKEAFFFYPDCQFSKNAGLFDDSGMANFQKMSFLGDVTCRHKKPDTGMDRAEPMCLTLLPPFWKTAHRSGDFMSNVVSKFVWRCDAEAHLTGSASPVIPPKASLYCKSFVTGHVTGLPPPALW